MHKKVKGFSLVELLTVVSIIGIVGAIATPMIVASLPNYALVRAARDMVSNFRKARSMAIKLHRSVVIEFNTTLPSYIVDKTTDMSGYNYYVPSDMKNGKHVSMGDYYGSNLTFGYPGRSTAVTFPGNQITFDSVGLTSGVTGWVYLKTRKSDQEKAKGNATPPGYRIGIRGLAGNIVMEKCGDKDSAGATINCLTD